MADIFFKPNLLLQVVDYAVHLHPCIAALFIPGKLFDEFALLTADDGGFNHNFTARRHKHYPVGYLVYGLPPYFPAALRTVRYAYACE